MPVFTQEGRAPAEIDAMLEAAGWQVQTRDRLNRTAAKLLASLTEYTILASPRSKQPL